jgi:hypothetical protein
MTFTEAAEEVLRIAGKPLHYKEITELAIEKNLLSHVGKSPEVTMGSRLAALIKKEDKENPIVRIKPGVFGLRDWGKKGRGGKDTSAAAAEAAEEPADESELDANEVNALEVEAATRGPVIDEGEEEEEVSGEDALRRDLAASGAELFDDEEDDDQPILGGPASQPASSAGAPGAGGVAGDQGEGGRRRRRRRRRGRGRGGEGGFAENGERGTERGADRGTSSAARGGDVIQPQAIVSVESDSNIDTTRDPLSPAPRPMVRDRQQIMAGGAPTGIEVPAGEVEDLSGRELADAALVVMSGFDRNQGPVGIRTVVEGLMRRGRMSGDFAAACSQLSASLRADTLRRESFGQRPRFRFASGQRVALVDWLLSGDLVRLEQEANAALERYREAARRLTLRKVQELPGHVFVELALVALEKAGLGNVRGVRRAGSPGGEVHFSGTHKTNADEVKVAVVIRKDGREIGRERVSDLRGALHHYGPATGGWLITTGQVLSGAKEEASAPSAPPVALYDGVAFCKLLEDLDVGVVRTRYTAALPDLELFETLRGS